MGSVKAGLELFGGQDRLQNPDFTGRLAWNGECLSFLLFSEKDRSITLIAKVV